MNYMWIKFVISIWKMVIFYNYLGFWEIKIIVFVGVCYNN